MKKSGPEVIKLVSVEHEIYHDDKYPNTNNVAEKACYNGSFVP